MIRGINVLKEENKVIDIHVHLAEYEKFREAAYTWFSQAFSSPEEYQAFCSKYNNPDEFIKLMDQNGVDYSVILAEVAPLTTGIATNDMVKTFYQGRSRLIPFCTFNPYLDAQIGNSLEDLYLNHGFRGVKLYPTYNHFYPNDTTLYPLYSVAERLSIPILFHTGSSIFPNSRIKYGNPIFYDDVAVNFPRLKIVMAHGGRGPWYDEAMTMVRLHKNIYIDIAGLPPQKLMEYFQDIERFAHKFVFGTDWPNVNVKTNIEKICKLPISDEAHKKILGNNAAQLLTI
jgi:uncharacterized protein